MREFDHNGLLLAEYQGKLFEKSVELDCSTGIFMRRFLHSDLLKSLDLNDPSLLSLDVKEGISDISRQYRNVSYGKNKYSVASLFWIGYMYRYIAYTREKSTSFIMKLFPYELMNEVYYTYHTQDPEWVIDNLLDNEGLDKNIFDNNYRLSMIIRKHMNINLKNT